MLTLMICFILFQDQSFSNVILEEPSLALETHPIFKRCRKREGRFLQNDNSEEASINIQPQAAL